jgi:hypothetical protein
MLLPHQRLDTTESLISAFEGDPLSMPVTQPYLPGHHMSMVTRRESGNSTSTNHKPVNVSRIESCEPVKMLRVAPPVRARTCAYVRGENIELAQKTLDVPRPWEISESLNVRSYVRVCPPFCRWPCPVLFAELVQRLPCDSPLSVLAIRSGVVGFELPG